MSGEKILKAADPDRKFLGVTANPVINGTRVPKFLTMPFLEVILTTITRIKPFHFFGRQSNVEAPEPAIGTFQELATERALFENVACQKWREHSPAEA